MRPTFHRALFLAMLALCTALATACENVDYVQLEPTEVVFKSLGDSKFMEAKCMSRAGVRATQAKVSWSVKDKDIATVSAKGELKPLKSGRTEVIAKYNDKIEGRSPLTVLLVEKLDVEPKQLTLTEGQAAAPIKLIMTAFDGRQLVDRQATYVPRDKKVAAIVGGNSVMPLDPGSTVIDIQVDGHKASVEVTVEKEKKGGK